MVSLVYGQDTAVLTESEGRLYSPSCPHTFQLNSNQKEEEIIRKLEMKLCLFPCFLAI